MTMLSVAQYKKMLKRDNDHCYHCGTTEGLVPNHRQNRGMGGSKAREVPSNVVTLCSFANNMIEANAGCATMARIYGWKLRDHENPLEEPVYDRYGGGWFLLDDTWSRVAVTGD